MDIIEIDNILPIEDTQKFVTEVREAFLNQTTETNFVDFLISKMRKPDVST